MSREYSGYKGRRTNSGEAAKMSHLRNLVLLFLFITTIVPFVLHSGVIHDKHGLHLIPNIKSKHFFLRSATIVQPRPPLMLPSSPTLARSRVVQYLMQEDPITKRITIRDKTKILSPANGFKNNSTSAALSSQREIGILSTDFSYEPPIQSWSRLALEDIQKEKERRATEDECIQMHAWQTTVFPSCNALQELDMIPDANTGNFQFINCGSSRCTFSLKTLSQDDDKEDIVVLKVPKYRKDLNSGRLESARMDGMIMERLTSSPYVASIYGLCGTSQLTEFSDGGNIHDRIKEVRLQQKGKRSNKVDIYGAEGNRLKIAIQVISAVADLHSFEKDGITSVVHQDICCHQIVLIDGVYKLGDFHLSALLQKNQDTGEVCPEQSQMHQKLRAPEEFAAKERDYEAIDLVPADVYMSGNIMYYLLTDRWVFDDVSSNQAAVAIQKGERSHISSSFRQSDDAYTKLLLEAIEMCWTHDPKKRPTARYISDYMKKGLAEIEGTDPSDVVKVKMPPLPSDHRYTDTDFYSNMW